MMDITVTQFSWLNAAGSMISIVVAPICGPMMDRLPLAYGITLGMLMIVFSQGVATLAIQTDNYPLMIISKCMFGFGFQPMIVGKDIIMAHWFYGAELSLANNLNLAISREVTFLTSIITPGITEAYGIT